MRNTTRKDVAVQYFDVDFEWEYDHTKRQYNFNYTNTNAEVEQLLESQHIDYETRN